MKVTRVLFFIGMLLSTLNASAQQFNIQGKSEGIANGTWLYLKTGDDLPLDSCEVKNNVFRLAGLLNESPKQVILSDKQFSNYVIFWLEPKSISINLKNGEFKKAMIKGSAAQDENIEIVKLVAPYSEAIDSLNKLLSAAKKDPVKMKTIFEALKTERSKEQTAYQNYIKTHPNSFLSVHILSIYATGWGKTKTNELYQTLSKK